VTGRNQMPRELLALRPLLHIQLSLAQSNVTDFTHEAACC